MLNYPTSGLQKELSGAEKKGLTKFFGTYMGLKQVCPVYKYMFNDDIVTLAPNPISLQYMINNIELYCIKWGIKINLQNSEVMVYSNGGKVGRKKK